MENTTENKDYMGMALAEAEAAARAGEVPVGAVIVGPTGDGAGARPQPNARRK